MDLAGPAILQDSLAVVWMRHESAAHPPVAARKRQSRVCHHRRQTSVACGAAANQAGSSGSASFSASASAGRTGRTQFKGVAAATATTTGDEAGNTPTAPATAAQQADAVAAVADAEAEAGSTASVGGFWNAARLRQQIQTLGLAGVAAYGVFNLLYYSCTFLFFWTCIVKVPTGQGRAATAKAFAGVMAMVWAGSQVTKAPRAAAALMLAPLMDRGMGWMQRALGLKSRRAVFFVFLAACLSLEALLFAAVVLLWS